MDNYILRMNEQVFCEYEDIDPYDDLFEDELMHYGVGPDDNPPGRGSGRYPKGFGENPNQHDIGLNAIVSDLKKKGMSESEIALYLGFENRKGQAAVSVLRAHISMEKNRRMRDLSQKVPELKERGLSNDAIAEKLGISPSSVRNYLDKNRKLNFDKNTVVANALKEKLKEKNYIDVGPGVELEAGVSKDRMKTAIEMLKAEGYKEHLVKVEQLGQPGQFTTVKVLGNPDTDWKTVKNDPSLIKPYTDYFEDNGETKLGLQPPKSIDSSRIYVNYAEDGGTDKDGLIELRRGVDDISLGNNRYAQVRIAVDGTHYMKGMAVYSDNVPPGYDIIYNSNKKKGTPLCGDDDNTVAKHMQTNADGSINMDNPFGATIKANTYDKEGHITAGGQSYYIDKDGNRQLRVINKVNDEGDWQKWSKTISAQFLSKQQLPLIRKQLELTYQDKLTEYEEYKSLTNPTIKKKLLEGFADDCDASAVHLKAKAFPGQASHVLIPVPSLKGDESFRKTFGFDGEVYAPNYKTGDQLALVRYPHAGQFEIALVRVNNNNKEGDNYIGKNAPDAIGINSYIASKLSGADFDGDTAAVIPVTKNGKSVTEIKSMPMLKGLEGFNTKDYKYADPDAHPKMKSQTKQTQMGITTNLISDMQTLGNPTEEELVRAVKHSMVVIDAQKHHLDYKRSEIENNIQQLKDKYQPKYNDDGTQKEHGGGASSLITRAKSSVYIPERKLASFEDPDVIDPKTGKPKKTYGLNPYTGEKYYVPSEATHPKKVNVGTKDNPVYEYIQVKNEEKVPWMSKESDARKLLSSQDNPNPKELAYANYANRMKDLAREARLEAYRTPKLERDPKAAKEYAKEVKDLDDKLLIAEKNAPKERQAQVLASVTYKYQIKANPEIEGDKEHLKRLRGQSLDRARRIVGAKKVPIDITDREWEAIQKGAISDTKLKKILDNTDQDKFKQRATPRNNQALDTSKKQLAITMARNNFTNADIAERLGVSASTVSKILTEAGVAE